jgi:Reverse transcriptase (RNA-dependent DNA polymerase)
MPAGYSAEFLSLGNFQLAWERILRGSNVQYKRYFTHLFPSYQFASQTILRDLVARIRQGHYSPSKSNTVYIPKPTRILRPITLVSLNDQVVYQAIANFIADKFRASLTPNYGIKTFGAQYAGRKSKFFYRPWEHGYSAFNSAIRSAYRRGKVILADFDLVSFFDLIDHKILRTVLERKVKNGETLDLLFECLEKWTAGNPNIISSRHGIPQGPEPSAFLADVFLHDFDEMSHHKVSYFRYVDDIKLLAKTWSPVRRALLRLDLQSKCLGLVPQAQKIDVRLITDIEAELKTIPSMIADTMGPSGQIVRGKYKIRRLERFLRRALERVGGKLRVRNETHFKFALYRMPKRRRILRLVKPLLHLRPDLSVVLGYYASQFRASREAALILHDAIKSDPVFDATAGDYVLALDVCTPRPVARRFKEAVSRLILRSEEKSTLLEVPARLFLCKISGKAASIDAVETEANPMTASRLIDFFLSKPQHASLSPKDLSNALRRFATQSTDEDLSRYCTYLLLSELKLIPGSPRPSGALLLEHLGYPVPPGTSLLTAFFRDVFGVRAALDWELLLGKKAHSESQRRAVLIRGKWSGSPSLMVTVIDNFNDLLLQRFSRRHPNLRLAFRRASGRHAIPDYGSWINHPAVVALLPRANPILVECHNLRLKAEIAHSTQKKTGKFTRAVTYKEREKLVLKLRLAYLEWLAEWAKI